MGAPRLIRGGALRTERRTRISPPGGMANGRARSIIHRAALPKAGGSGACSSRTAAITWMRISTPTFSASPRTTVSNSRPSRVARNGSIKERRNCLRFSEEPIAIPRRSVKIASRPVTIPRMTTEVSTCIGCNKVTDSNRAKSKRFGETKVKENRGFGGRRGLKTSEIHVIRDGMKSFCSRRWQVERFDSMFLANP